MAGLKRGILFIVFLVWTTLLPTSGDDTTLAVLDFENNSIFNSEEVQPLSKGLAEIMITELNGIQAIRVVERQRFRSMLDELKLSQSGLVSEKKSVEVGKLIGAQHLVFGGYIVAPNEKIRIDVRIVEVETGLTIKAGEVTGKIKDVLSLIKKLSIKILKDLDVRMTDSEKKTLGDSKKLDMKAIVLFSKGLEYEDLGQNQEAIACYQKALEIESNFKQAKDRIERLSGQ